MTEATAHVQRTESQGSQIISTPVPESHNAIFLSGCFHWLIDLSSNAIAIWRDASYLEMAGSKGTQFGFTPLNLLTCLSWKTDVYFLHSLAVNRSRTLSSDRDRSDMQPWRITAASSRQAPSCLILCGTLKHHNSHVGGRLVS